MQLYATPRLVPRVGRRARRVHDEEEEGEPECERERDWRAVDAEAGVVDKIDVERDVDGRDENEHVCGRIHDSLTLQVFFEAFKANISRCSEQQQPQILLCVSTELFFLAEGHQDRRHVRPCYANGDEEEPQDGYASLKMDR
jgi:hypothetical protein